MKATYVLKDINIPSGYLMIEERNQLFWIKVIVECFRDLEIHFGVIDSGILELMPRHKIISWKISISRSRDVLNLCWSKKWKDSIMRKRRKGSKVFTYPRWLSNYRLFLYWCPLNLFIYPKWLLLCIEYIFYSIIDFILIRDIYEW